MLRFILLWMLIVLCPSWGMKDGEEYLSDDSSGSILDLSSFPAFSIEEFEGLKDFEARPGEKDARIRETIRECLDTLPSVLKPERYTPDSYHSSDYEDTEEAEAAFEEFYNYGSEALKYQALRKKIEARKKVRLEQSKRSVSLIASMPAESEKETLVPEEDAVSSTSTELDETASLNWGIVETITEETKDKPDPLSRPLEILKSLETSPEVSPSKKEAIHRLRGANWKNLISIPHYGWQLVGAQDLEVLRGKCALCNHRLRHAYVLVHPESEDLICVGRTCAHHLLKDRSTAEEERARSPSLKDVIESLNTMSLSSS